MSSISRTLLATIALALSAGCSGQAPLTTSATGTYVAGANGDLGSVQARALVMVGDQGKPALLSGALVNRGTTDASVSVQVAPGQDPIVVTVPAGQLVTLGTAPGPQISTAKLTAAAGGQITVGLATPRAGAIELLVPVLAAEGEYATLTPRPTPTVKPQATPGGQPSGPAPTATRAPN